MANIPIWPGSSSFSLTSNPTPFAFYDDDDQFREDADKVTTWYASRLGYPLIDIELQAINFYTCFEESVSEYGAQVYQFQIINNFNSLLGTPTGSALNNTVVDPNLSTMVQISENYGNQVQGGTYGNQKILSGSLDVKKGQQRYDLIDNIGSTISGSVGAKIKKIYHNLFTFYNNFLY